MPCWTYMTAETDPGKMMGGPLIAALKEMGLNPRHPMPGEIEFTGGSYNFKTGKLSFQGQSAYDSEELTQKIKRHYGAAAVKEAAKRFNWQVKQTGDFEYEIVKR